MTKKKNSDIIYVSVRDAALTNRTEYLTDVKRFAIWCGITILQGVFKLKMGKHIDLTGKKFERLYVTGNFILTKQGRRKWECRCDCGKTAWVVTNNLLSNKTKSCGCLNEEVKTKLHTKHGMSQSRIYSIWSNMKSRCECKTNYAYKWYGARGIKICDEWHNFENFAKWALTNGYKKNLTIDRINNNGNYCPENCRWATVKEQANNTRSCRMITYKGETKTMRAWEEEMGFSRGIIYSRLKQGWSEKEAIETKIRVSRMR